MDKATFLNKIKNELIVSCQAQPGEPLHGPEMMAKMSLSAKTGGAVAIRANGQADILAIRKETGLPTIGIVKKVYETSDVYITPTIREIRELIDSNTEVIALDATPRPRPDNVPLRDLIAYIREHSDCLIMGDVSTVEEGAMAMAEGVDFVSTTLSGYTPYSRQTEETDFQLITELSELKGAPVIAEGKIRDPKDAVKAFSCGAHSIVVGTAITCPGMITKRFVDAIK